MKSVANNIKNSSVPFKCQNKPWLPASVHNNLVMQESIFPGSELFACCRTTVGSGPISSQWGENYRQLQGVSDVTKARSNCLLAALAAPQTPRQRISSLTGEWESHLVLIETTFSLHIHWSTWWEESGPARWLSWPECVPHGHRPGCSGPVLRAAGCH